MTHPIPSNLSNEIEEVLKLHETTYAHDGFNRYGWNPATAQALATLFNKQIVAARINEIKKVWGNAREYSLTDIEMIAHRSGGQVDFIEAVSTDYLETRLNILNKELE